MIKVLQAGVKLIIITLCTCARGKVIGRVVIVVVVVVVVIVVISTKVAKSQKIGIGQSTCTLCHQTVESHGKLPFVCFKSLRTAHEHYKSCVFTSHAY